MSVAHESAKAGHSEVTSGLLFSRGQKAIFEMWMTVETRSTSTIVVRPGLPGCICSDSLPSSNDS